MTTDDLDMLRRFRDKIERALILITQAERDMLKVHGSGTPITQKISAAVDCLEPLPDEMSKFSGEHNG